MKTQTHANPNTEISQNAVGTIACDQIKAWDSYTFRAKHADYLSRREPDKADVHLADAARYRRVACANLHEAYKTLDRHFRGVDHCTDPDHQLRD